MNFPSVWGVWTLLILLPGVLSQDCLRLQLQEVFNKDAQNSLKIMGGPFPLECKTTRESLRTKSLNLHHLVKRLQTQDRIQIVHQTLRHISKIYSMNLASVTWARDKVEHFRLLLDRQLSQLEECVRKPGSSLRRNSAIHNYFRKLEKFLNQEGFSDCAWEIIRTETRARLQQLLFITAQISRRN
ncbi:interferon beta-like [Scyliorhinus canicula]|uniref:interferon beta-like n=1 Tax=Scyliorhinus canicula TaxID=7830 RepID=UPI0018F76B68|nr:interferon beta-like [Scyliorhinus canicula]